MVRFEEAVSYEIVVTFAFALLYFLYSYTLADDFALLEGNRWEDAQNALYFSSLLQVGSLSGRYEPKTPAARGVVTLQAIVRATTALYYVLA